MAIVAALAIHEAGHLLAAIILNIKFKRVKITLFGFNLNADLENIGLIKKFFLFSAGPIFNIILYFMLRYSRYSDFADINIFLSLINMVPIVPLDGGNICKSILESIIDNRSVCRYMIMTNWFFIICFLVIVYLFKKWLYLLLIFMAVRGIIEENRHLLEKSIRHNFYAKFHKK